MSNFVVRAADVSRDFPFSHPWNPSTEIRMRPLSDPAGLRRTGVHLVCVATGKASFPLHTHRCEEEWIYVLAGRALCKVGEESFTVDPGDFIGLPAGAPAHHISNPFSEELRYLTGGERGPVDVADFPELGKRIVRVGAKMAVHNLADAGPSPFARFGLEDL